MEAVTPKTSLKWGYTKTRNGAEQSRAVWTGPDKRGCGYRCSLNWRIWRGPPRYPAPIFVATAIATRVYPFNLLESNFFTTAGNCIDAAQLNF